MSRWRRIRFRLLAVCLSLLLIVTLIEVVLRLFTDKGISLLVRDEEIGRRYDPDFVGEMYIPEAQRKVHFRFTRDGYRGPDRPRKKPGGVRRIAVIGDSFIAAVGVDEEDTVVAQLEQNLGEGWEVLNFGISGNSSGQSLLTWRHFARHYEADIVIYFFTILNDVMENAHGLSHGVRPHFTLDDGELVVHRTGRTRNFASRLLRHSRFYVWQKHVVRGLTRSALSTAGIIPNEALILKPELTPEFERAWTITEAILATMKDEVEATGTPFIFCVVPSIGQYDTEAWDRSKDRWKAHDAGLDPDFPDTMLKGIIERHELRWFPLLPAFRKGFSSGPLNFRGGHLGGHWNEKGNHMVAAELHRQLTDSGLLR